MKQHPLRAFIEQDEYDRIVERSRNELDATPSAVVRTLIRLWMADELTLTAEQMVQMRGRSASTD